MKAMIARKRLAEAAQAVKGLVAKDRTSAFSRIRLDLSGVPSVTGSNGDVQIEWRFDGTVEKAGAAALPGSAFASFAGALPEGDVRIDSEAHRRLTLSCGGVAFRLAEMPAEDYPTMKGPQADASAHVKIAADRLRDMLRKVRFAVAASEVRKVLAGVNVSLDAGSLAMTATDGKILAHVHVESGFAAEGEVTTANVTLPVMAVKTLYGLLEDEREDEVFLDIGGTAVRVVGGRWCLTAKVLDGVYPNWSRAVPDVQHGARMNRARLRDAVTLAALATEGSGGVKVTIADGRATCEAESEIATSRTEIDGCRTDEGSQVAFRINPNLLTAALESLDEDEITVGFVDGRSAFKLTSEPLPWVAVIMPYREG